MHSSGVSFTLGTMRLSKKASVMTSLLQRSWTENTATTCLYFVQIRSRQLKYGKVVGMPGLAFGTAAGSLLIPTTRDGSHIL